MKTVMVTSLSPKRVELQTAALKSWESLGFPVISLNSPEEIDVIRAAFPSATIERTDRSAQQSLGKPLVMLDSVWDYARRTGCEMLCVLNSDLYLRNVDRVRALIEQPFDLLYGSRDDVDDVNSPSGQIYAGGYDYFFIRRPLLEAFPPSQYCLGAPWWDYWVPMVALQQGRQVRLSRDAPFAHVKHELNWNVNWHAIMGLHFAQYLLERWWDGKPSGGSGNSAGDSTSDSAGILPGDWRDGREIFAEFFFRRMRSLSDVMSGKTTATPALLQLLEHELIKNYAHAVAAFLRNHSTPV